ncbi:methyl-accepting chemotaxis protein [Paenibacillus kobensis]|uniref:methyl-accepting chemotaxis protein n=1 Tax=Paenibacillus kobensis TaxID=59841 RepID=UPI000FD862E6|nr:methyl-accepting chemotaxis protein [Paenibacillus kobensis]
MIKLNFRMKMLILTSIPFMLYLFSSIYYPRYFNTQSDHAMNQVYETAYKASSDILNADRDVYQAQNAYLQWIPLKAGEAKDAAAKSFEENTKQAQDRVKSAKTLIEQAGLLDATAEGSNKPVRALFGDFEQQFGQWSTDVSAAINNGGVLTAEQNEAFETGRAGLNSITDELDSYAHQSIIAIEDDNKKMTQSTLIISIVLIVVLAVSLLLTLRRIGNSVRTAASKTSRIMSGDLTVQPESNYSSDELGTILKSTDSMIGNLKSMIGSIVDNTGKVAGSAEQMYAAAKETAESATHVAANIQEVTAGSEVQAKSADETYRAMEEMTVGIVRIADNTTAMADQSIHTSANAKDGREALDRLIEQMNEVGQTLAQLSETVHTLEHRSGQIGQIAEEITAFASQTSILSLNASIEAARAGEYGRGFAVVAGEIRKLSAQSLVSADNIRELVGRTQEDIAGASGYMSQTLREVEHSSLRIAALDEQFVHISASVQQMTDQLQENSAITEQLSASAEQVSASTEQSSSVSAVNLGRIQSVAAAAEQQLALMGSMSEAASQLQQIVSDLKRAAAYFKVS